jgi:hypothetical protein
MNGALRISELRVLAIIVFTFIASGCSRQLRGDLIIKNATVICVEDGAVNSSMDIGITKDRITDIVPTRKKTNYITNQLIDGSGQYIIPGLWDMHTHTWWAYNEFFPLLLANGITGIREMWGEPDSIDIIRSRIDRGVIIGPDIISSGAIIDGKPPYWDGSDIADSPSAAREIVRNQKAKGADFIKVYSYLERDDYFAIADECKKEGISFCGHIPFKISLEEAVHAGQGSLEHFYGMLDFCSKEKEFLTTTMRDTNCIDSLFEARTFSTFIHRMRFETTTYDTSKLSGLITLLAESNSWLCPTMITTVGAIDRLKPDFEPKEIIRYMPDFAVEGWQPRSDSALLRKRSMDRAILNEWYNLVISLFRPLKDGGVNFLAGTDYPNPNCYPGFSLHDELQLFVEKAGFTPLEALQTATVNPALFLKLNTETGSVEVGKKANLLLLKANPLENINNTRQIEAVILRGQVHRSTVLMNSLEKQTGSAESTIK